MTTAFALLCQVCGLSQREAAELLEVRLDTVKSWSAGRNRAPGRVLSELARLAAAIERAADEAMKAAADAAEKIGAEAETIELGLASDDAEARTLGWPCVGAHRAVLGRIAARLIADGRAVMIVPRGSTVASSAAADAHGH